MDVEAMDQSVWVSSYVSLCFGVLDFQGWGSQVGEPEDGPNALPVISAGRFTDGLTSSSHYV